MKHGESEVAIGCDHAAFEAKERLKGLLQARGRGVHDFGVHSTARADYPDVARPLAEAVSRGDFCCGVLLCGTGLGMSYVANRFPGVRASLCWSTEAAQLARDHNDANILVLPGRIPTLDPLEAILTTWLDTPFSDGERHQRRIDKIECGMGVTGARKPQ